ncbi:MAG: thiopurine S-methyltransferase [Pseudomonadota bacterium]
MDASYWHQKWAQGDIGFHQADYNALMVKHFSELRLNVGAHVFVPLCGKTRDIGWLLEQGYRVTGAELSEAAVQELFAGLGMTPQVTQDGALRRYATTDLVVFVGDVFDVTARVLGPVHAVYDRAALVALPDDVRRRYAAHVISETGRVPQFVLTFTYDQSAMNGPPFSITADMVADLFDRDFALRLIECVTLPGSGLKGRVPAAETAWRLVPL